jgi:hypothetical protein
MDIFVMGADGANVVNLTNGSGRNLIPMWHGVLTLPETPCPTRVAGSLKTSGQPNLSRPQSQPHLSKESPFGSRESG